MPWNISDSLSEQRKFIIAWIGEVETSFIELCKRYGISPKSGYKRVSRFKELGLECMGDLPRNSRMHPNQITAEVVEMLVRAKRQHMTHGPSKTPCCASQGTSRTRPSPTEYRKLAIWWTKLGIIPERIRPGHPEENGRHERMHRTLKDAVASPPKSSFRAQQKAFNWFIDDYNEVRPHEALGQKTPASIYYDSPRRYPDRIDQPEYTADVTVRRVRTNGEIRWKGSRVFISEALVGEPVGLQQISERTWAIYYGPLEIGILNETTMKAIKTPVKVLPMCPD